MVEHLVEVSQTKYSSCVKRSEDYECQILPPDCTTMRIQGITPSVATLFLRSTRNQLGNVLPTHGTVRSNRILNFLSSSAFYFPVRAVVGFTLATSLQVIIPSLAALVLRSTRNQRISSQFLQPYAGTAFFNFLFSSAVQRPARAIMSDRFLSPMYHAIY
jgi:hypothetical protein